MCGRFTLTVSAEKLQEFFPLFDLGGLAPGPRYNIAPTQQVLAARKIGEDSRPRLAFLRWGLIPSWADDPKIGYRLINARADSAATKPSFRSAFRQRRCLILADGFFEWQKVGKTKQPYHIRLKGGQPFAFAGLWESWKKGTPVADAPGSATTPLETCTILTTDANELVRTIHDRMPVILPPQVFDRWLDPTPLTREETEPGSEIASLLGPFPAGEMEMYPVSIQVNNARHDDFDCLQRA